jgi:hypothetical protein
MTWLFLCQYNDFIAVFSKDNEFQNLLSGSVAIHTIYLMELVICKSKTGLKIKSSLLEACNTTKKKILTLLTHVNFSQPNYLLDFIVKKHKSIS